MMSPSIPFVVSPSIPFVVSPSIPFVVSPSIPFVVSPSIPFVESPSKKIVRGEEATSRPKVERRRLEPHGPSLALHDSGARRFLNSVRGEPVKP